MRTRLPTPCGSRSRHCASGSANRGSSRQCPASGTASTQRQTPPVKEASVDRPAGLSVRLKLTLSYAGFLMLAGALLLAVVWLFLLRYVPDGAVITRGPSIPNQSDLVRAFAPRAAAALGLLLVFGLVGGWILAGRMLA